MSGILTHEQLLQAVGHVAEAALPRWGLGGAALKMINHSENTTYLVTPNNGARPVILRVHRDGYHSVDGIKQRARLDARAAGGSKRADAAGHPRQGRRGYPERLASRAAAPAQLRALRPHRRL